MGKTPGEPPHILIVGGGYVGMYTALGLQSKLSPGDASITVVDPQAQMTYQPFLPERLRLLDADLPRRLADAFARHLWVEKVERVEVTPQHPQRQVVTLRDVEGLSSVEVCGVLGITEGNQRVLLHRGRARIRSLVEGDVLG